MNWSPLYKLNMIPFFVKKLFPQAIKQDIKENLGVPSLRWSLMNIKKLGFTSNFALDIGAYEGEWALSFAEVFPNAKVLMCEAQSQKKEKLKSLTNQHPNLTYHIALLSSQDGKKLFFNENETASHVTDAAGVNSKEVTSESLDEIVKRKGLDYPDFLKLDVQGFEMEVLDGGKECLSEAEFCLLEVTMINLGSTPVVTDIISYMDTKGFQLYDITQLMRRPYDKALYQSDFLFIKKTSALIAAKRWD